MALRDVDYVPVHIHVHQCRTRVLVPWRLQSWLKLHTRACVYASARGLAMTADPRANWTGLRGSSRSITPDIRRAAVTIRQLTGLLFTIREIVIPWSAVLPIHALLLPFPSQEAASFQGRTRSRFPLFGETPVELKERWSGESGGEERGGGDRKRS